MFPRHSIRLQLDNLEIRECPSAVVTLRNHVLSIVGDAANDQAAVEIRRDDTLVTIGMGDAVSYGTGIYKIVFNGHGGDNSFIINFRDADLQPPAIQAKLGLGHNTFHLNLPNGLQSPDQSQPWKITVWGGQIKDEIWTDIDAPIVTTPQWSYQMLHAPCIFNFNVRAGMTIPVEQRSFINYNGSPGRDEINVRMQGDFSWPMLFKCNAGAGDNVFNLDAVSARFSFSPDGDRPTTSFVYRGGRDSDQVSTSFSWGASGVSFSANVFGGTNDWTALILPTIENNPSYNQYGFHGDGRTHVQMLVGEENPADPNAPRPHLLVPNNIYCTLSGDESSAAIDYFNVIVDALQTVDIHSLGDKSSHHFGLTNVDLNAPMTVDGSSRGRENSWDFPLHHVTVNAPLTLKEHGRGTEGVTATHDAVTVNNRLSEMLIGRVIDSQNNADVATKNAAFHQSIIGGVGSQLNCSNNLNVAAGAVASVNEFAGVDSINTWTGNMILGAPDSGAGEDAVGGQVFVSQTGGANTLRVGGSVGERANLDLMQACARDGSDTATMDAVQVDGTASLSQVNDPGSRGIVVIGGTVGRTGSLNATQEGARQESICVNWDEAERGRAILKQVVAALGSGTLEMDGTSAGTTEIDQVLGRGSTAGIIIHADIADTGQATVFQDASAGAKSVEAEWNGLLNGAIAYRLLGSIYVDRTRSVFRFGADSTGNFDGAVQTRAGDDNVTFALLFVHPDGSEDTTPGRLTALNTDVDLGDGRGDVAIATPNVVLHNAEALIPYEE